MKTALLAGAFPICLALAAAPSASGADVAIAGRAKRAPREPVAGLLYYAKADAAFADNAAVIANPSICGALFQIVWSEVEKADGQCDWSELDRWIAPWLKAGKKVAIRFLWSTSGYWPKPYYKTPTPAWVWKAGAAYAIHKPSGTEIPLIWDPIYKEFAWRLMEQFAARYDGNAGVLLVDVTPGAETNPYRFGTINQRNPEFKDEYAQTKASDGRSYSEELWLASVKEWIDAADRIFPTAPLLVTLNTGSLRGGSRLAEIGAYCIDKGFYVGQNGLGARSYRDSGGEGRPASPFFGFSKQTALFFEMGHGTRGRSDELMEVMKAAERIRCSYLNVYPEDVMRGTRGQANFDPQAEAALQYGARVVRAAKSRSVD